MVKYYCDLCGDEIVKNNEMPTVLIGEKKAKVHGRGLITLHTRIEVGDGNGDRNVDHIFCKYCVIDSVANLDNRDKAVCEKCGR